jgi:hypothetical protein
MARAIRSRWRIPLIAASAECRAIVDKLAVLTRIVLTATHRLVSTAAPELARRWALEQARVNERHVWDIGQSLVRGAAVRDPGLESWRRDGEGVSYVYRGIERTAVLDRRLWLRRVPLPCAGPMSDGGERRDPPSWRC